MYAPTHQSPRTVARTASVGTVRGSARAERRGRSCPRCSPRTSPTGTRRQLSVTPGSVRTVPTRAEHPAERDREQHAGFAAIDPRLEVKDVRPRTVGSTGSFGARLGSMGMTFSSSSIPAPSTKSVWRNHGRRPRKTSKRRKNAGNHSVTVTSALRIGRAAMAAGTKDDPWELTTPPGSSAYTMYRDDDTDPPARVPGRLDHVALRRPRHRRPARVAAHARRLGTARRGRRTEAGQRRDGGGVGRSPDNPIGGWYGCARATAAASACTCHRCSRRSASPRSRTTSATTRCARSRETETKCLRTVVVRYETQAECADENADWSRRCTRSSQRTPRQAPVHDLSPRGRRHVRPRRVARRRRQSADTLRRSQISSPVWVSAARKDPPLRRQPWSARTALALKVPRTRTSTATCCRERPNESASRQRQLPKSPQPRD